MQINRHFTKVYEEERKPLSAKLFLRELDKVIINDAIWLLGGETDDTQSVSPKTERDSNDTNS